MDETCLAFSSNFHTFSSGLCGLQRNASDPHCQFNAVDRDVRFVGLIAEWFWQLDGSFFEPPVP